MAVNHPLTVSYDGCRTCEDGSGIVKAGDKGMFLSMYEWCLGERDDTDCQHVTFDFPASTPFYRQTAQRVEEKLPAITTRTKHNMIENDKRLSRS